ncbi:MAG: STAS domain-containing protein [Bacilli bacterium]
MLKIYMEFRKGILFVRLNGILTKDTIDILNSEVLETIKNNGIKYLSYNLEELEYIDIMGIKGIIESFNLINNNNGQLILCGYKDLVKIRLEKNKLFDYINHTSNELKVFELIKV